MTASFVSVNTPFHEFSGKNSIRFAALWIIAGAGVRRVPEI
ncbi:hypothetical protein AGRO_5379 [Agrobacterium sp. ATCC 31749]|nr:hypothetical protein AGRO_5379 [Agrobacterium sp. ATCC 31749]